MSGLIVILAVIVGLVVLDILAQTYGVDSRSGSTDPRSPIRGIN